MWITFQKIILFIPVINLLVSNLALNISCNKYNPKEKISTYLRVILKTFAINISIFMPILFFMDYMNELLKEIIIFIMMYNICFIPALFCIKEQEKNLYESNYDYDYNDNFLKRIFRGIGIVFYIIVCIPVSLFFGFALVYVPISQILEALGILI